ncbi:MAG: stage III sporulation AC/AD family protein [Oscillospiraceae bacterium]|jgi:stage III sporulation protein AD|nr:stage III sporulation AC/AD family protein [Oscillospiraceae bacterium]
MDHLSKVIAAAVAGSALGLVVRKNNPESSLLLSAAAAVFAMYMSFEVISGVFDFLREIAEKAGIPDATLSVVLKTAGISVVTRLISDLCRDAGQASAASGVEFIGALTAVYIALPLFQTALDMIYSILK